jgi:hypothetical protein
MPNVTYAECCTLFVVRLSVVGASWHWLKLMALLDSSFHFERNFKILLNVYSTDNIRCQHYKTWFSSSMMLQMDKLDSLSLEV